MIISAKDLRKKENLEMISCEKPGYYKWWASYEHLQILLNNLDCNFDIVEKFIEKKDNLYCIYAGVAIKESIQDRLNWHINDKHTPQRVINGFLSTFRKSLSSVICRNQFNKEKTNEFIDGLYVEYFEVDLPIKSDSAKHTIHQIEKDILAKNLLILNIQENHHPMSQNIKKKLKQLRKESKQQHLMNYQ